jgi:uncharacterized OB-fold protein
MTVPTIQRDAASAKFFDGTARGELLIRRCDDCAHPNAPQSTTCARCGSDGLAWTPARGTGTIATWSVVYGRPRDDVAAPRSVVAVVELDEGPWLHAQIADADPGTVAIGLPVAVEFVRPDGGEAIPVFRLA